jgi:hypothetical protein
LVVFGWFERGTIIRSFGVAGRAEWDWLLAACAFELLSMIAFARTQRIVLRAAGVHVSIPSVAATALAGNAISVSLPLIGPGAGSVFTYQRFRQVAESPAPAGWTLLISGLISNLVWVFLIAVGGIVSGNPAAIWGGLFVAACVVGFTIIGVLSLRRQRSRKLVIRIGIRFVSISQRLSGRPVGDPSDLTGEALDAVTAFRMRNRDWAQTIGLSMINWFASVGCFVAAILATGASVPWTKVIIVYCIGATASSFNLTPGGLGVTEAVLAAGLVASGMGKVQALGSALIFRLVSFWLIMLVGWAIYSGIRRNRSRRVSSSLTEIIENLEDR